MTKFGIKLRPPIIAQKIEPPKAIEVKRLYDMRDHTITVLGATPVTIVNGIATTPNMPKPVGAQLDWGYNAKINDLLNWANSVGPSTITAIASYQAQWNYGIEYYGVSCDNCLLNVWWGTALPGLWVNKGQKVSATIFVLTPAPPSGITLATRISIKQVWPIP